MIDTNVSIGHWPFRRLPDEDLASITARLQRKGVTQAWVGSLDGLFDRDVARVNEQLAQDCKRAEAGMLLPFGTVNPTLPDWEEDLRRCAEVHKFRGIRLHPGFHGYELNDSVFAKLLQQSAERQLVVQLVVTMEDERTQHPVLRVPFVDLAPLPKLLETNPKSRLVILNAFRKLTLDEAARLATAGQVWFDTAMLEGVDKLTALTDKVNSRRILFGSHFPLFYIDSAVLKLRESMLPEPIIQMIKSDNARRLLES